MLIGYVQRSRPQSAEEDTTKPYSFDKFADTADQPENTKNVINF